MSELIVHILTAGRSLCRISDRFGVPGDWPEGHKWVARDFNVDDANCEYCIKIHEDPKCLNYKAAVEAAKNIDKELLATSKMFNRSVTISHEDGTHLFWKNAFAKMYMEVWVIVFPEHHELGVYHIDDLHFWAQLGEDIEIDPI